MRARVVRRRDDGVVLAAPAPVVEGASLLELVVVEITEQSARRPIKVARLRPIGEQRILAQLKMPRLVKFQGWTMVLSGIEELRDQHGQIRGVAQTWVCELRPPENAVGFRVRDTHQVGVRRPGNAMRERSGTQGKLAVGCEFSNALQRHTICAEVHRHQISTFAALRLVDCYLEWMSDQSFEIGGLRVHEAHGERPQQVLRDGWVCEIDIYQRELTKHEARMLR